MKIVYTASGAKAIEDYSARKIFELHKKIEDQVVSNKYVLGDDTVEVTATDVKQAVKILDKPSRSTWLKIIIKLYMALGVATTLAGIFFETFLNTFSVLFKNPIQLILFSSGLLLIIFSYVTLQKIRMREIERQEKMEQQSSTMNFQNSKVEIYKNERKILEEISS